MQSSLKKFMLAAGIFQLSSIAAAAEQGFFIPYLNDPISAGKIDDLNGYLTLFPGMKRSILSDMDSILPTGGKSMTPQKFESIAEIDRKVVYFPWTRLDVVENTLKPGTLSLGFAYSRSGGMISATLKASTDWAQLQKQLTSYAATHNLKPKDIQIKPIQPRKGAVKSTVVFPNGSELAVGTNVVDNALPTGHMAMSIAMNKPMADIVNVAMHTGAAVGWNWAYEFDAAIVPFSAQIKIDWKSVIHHMKAKFTLQSIVTKLSIEKEVRDLIEKQFIVIQIQGGEDYQKEEAAIWDVVKIVLAKTFKSNHPELGDLEQLQLPTNNGGTSWLASGNIPGMNLGGFGFQNFSSGVTGTFAMKELDSTEQFSETIILVSAPYKSVTFNAGIQIGGLCNTHPEYFAYEATDGSIVQGCSSRVLPNRGEPMAQTPPPAQVPNPVTPVPPANPTPVPAPAPGTPPNMCAVFPASC